MSTEREALPPDLQTVDAVLRATAQIQEVREESARVLLGLEPRRIRRIAAVEAARASGARSMQNAALDEGEAEEEDIPPVDMEYYRESRL